MKKLLTILLLGVGMMVCAQQNTGFREGNIQSPIVHKDQVTFRVLAPKAKKVEVIGDWEQNGGHAAMKKGKSGVWECTIVGLPSEMYTYRFVIDGVVGVDPTNPFTRRDVGNVFSIFFVDGGYGDLYQVHDVPHGTMTSTWYKSETAGEQRRLSIYLPPMYFDSKEKLPVLYLLHGSGGDETAWVELGNVARIMDNLIAEGRIRPMIVVMPNGNFAVPAAPGETSANLSYRPVMSNEIPGNYKNGNYEMSFPEIVNFVDTHYRTLATREGRALAGLSMGGFHTLFIALNHPDMFSFIGLFSAGLGSYFMDETREAYAGYGDKLRDLRDSGLKLFWLAIGETDFLYEANQTFRHEMDEIEFPYIYHESSRGHLWMNWRQYLVQFSEMIF